jgi:Ricin-type beta-trefoil lectin domain-like
MSLLRTIHNVVLFVGIALAGLPAAAQTYTIVNRLSGLALDDTNRSMSSGNPMQQWACNGQPQQNWTVAAAPGGGGYLTLQNQLSGLYLTSPSNGNGVHVVQEAASGGANQNWTIAQTVEGYVTIENEASQAVLDVINAGTTNGVQIQQWQADGGQQQSWILAPAGACITSQLTLQTNTPSLPSNTVWKGYPLPAGNFELVSLNGTLTMGNSENYSSEVLFVAGTQSGSCPTTQQQAPLPGSFWSYILKNPNAGTITAPVSYLLSTDQLPISNCLVIGFGGGPMDSVSNNTTTTITLSLSITWFAATPNQFPVGLGAEFCYGISSGCSGRTLDSPSTQNAFAWVYQIPQKGAINTFSIDYAWGDISDATWDAATHPAPTGSWTVSNDVYVYPSTYCGQFSNGPNGPANYYASIPSGAAHLLSVPVSASGVESQNPWVYTSFDNQVVYSGQCIVELVAPNSPTGGDFDFEDQINLIFTPLGTR